jgi:hypothetical protein
LRLREIGPGLKLQFGRKGVADGVEVKLVVRFLPRVFPQKLTIKALLTGTDAEIGGLLYPIAFLGSGESAIDMLHAHGYDVTVTGEFPTCQSVFPQEVCNKLAYGLSRSIYGALTAGPADLEEFLNGAHDLGYGPCAIIF